MAIRGSAHRRNPEGQLTGVLRDLNRAARTQRNRRAGASVPASAAVPPVQGPRGQRGLAGPRGGPPRAAVVVTGQDGRAVWEWERALGEVPVIGALVLVPPSGLALVLTLESVDERRAVLQVHPSVNGVEIHVTASPRSRADQA